MGRVMKDFVVSKNTLKIRKSLFILLLLGKITLKDFYRASNKVIKA